VSIVNAREARLIENNHNGNEVHVASVEALALDGAADRSLPVATSKEAWVVVVLALWASTFEAANGVPTSAASTSATEAMIAAKRPAIHFMAERRRRGEGRERSEARRRLENDSLGAECALTWAWPQGSSWPFYVVMDRAVHSGCELWGDPASRRKNGRATGDSQLPSTTTALQHSAPIKLVDTNHYQ
jgi:hypothetical protein